MKITNNTAARQGFHAVTGVVYANPGQTIDAELTLAQAERAKRIAGVTVEGEAVAEPPKGNLATLGLKVDSGEIKKAVKEFERTIAELQQSLTNKDEQIAARDEALAARDDLITALKDRIAELELEIEEIKKNASVPPAYEAKHRGGGSWSVMQGETEVVEKLDKAGAEAFNALSDEDKAKFVAEKSKAA